MAQHVRYRNGILDLTHLLALNTMPPDRAALFQTLSDHAKLFKNRGRLQKLLASPYRFLLSEMAFRSATVFEKQVKTFWGDTMALTLPEPVSLFVYRYGYFEEGLTAFFLAALKPGDTFMDVGSHYGYFSLLARHLVGETGRVVAFEPTPSTFAFNRRNTSRFKNIHVENKAAWSEEKTITLTDLGVAWSSHNSLLKPKMIPEKVRAASKTHTVPCVQLDRYIEEHGLRPNLMKIDAESAELEILKGMTRTLQNIRPMITLEVGDDPGSDVGVHSAEPVKYCAQFGYKAYIYHEGKIQPHRVLDSYEYDNVFMIPEELAR
jgi:FkbM family methyltransferase